MARHEYRDEKSNALVFVAYDGKVDLPIFGQHLFGTPRVKEIPEGCGEWSGRHVIMHHMSKAPWSVVKPKEVHPIPDYDVFVSIFGERPISQTTEGRFAKQAYADRLEDWGGILEGDFSVIEREYVNHGLSAPIFFANVNAAEEHGPFWMWSREADSSRPIPEGAEIGFAVARHQRRAWVMGWTFSLAQVHKFNKMLLNPVAID